MKGDSGWSAPTSSAWCSQRSRTRSGKWRGSSLQAAPLWDAAEWIDRYRRFWDSSLTRLDAHLAAVQAAERATEQRAKDPSNSLPREEMDFDVRPGGYRRWTEVSANEPDLRIQISVDLTNVADCELIEGVMHVGATQGPPVAPTALGRPKRAGLVRGVCQTRRRPNKGPDRGRP
jgi:hypothetical protein